MTKENRDKRILVHGAFFSSNFGDVLFNDVFSSEINKNNIVLQGRIGQYIKKRLNIKINSEIINFFKSDAVVFAPGGYFGEPNKSKIEMLHWRVRMLFRHAYLGVLCNIFNKPYSIIGIGVGPIDFALGKKIVKYIFDNAKVVTVRDDESMQYLKEMNVKNKNISITVDSILCLRDELLKANSIIEAKKIIGTNKKTILLHITSGGEKGLEIAKATKSFIQENREYQVLICTDFLLEKSNEYIDSVQSIFEREDYKFVNFSPELLSAVINLSDIIITTKLHVGIVGIAFEKSVLAFPVHSKTVRLYRQIKESGRCVPINNVTINKVNELIEYYKDKNIVLADDIILKSKENYTKLQEFINQI